MGLVARALGSAPASALPTQFYPTGSNVSPANYNTFAREGYSGSELVFSAIELLATSAAEPKIIGRRMRRASPSTAPLVAQLATMAPHLERAMVAGGMLDVTQDMLATERRILASRGMHKSAIEATLVRNGYIQELPTHPLVQLLNNPNPYMTRFQFWSTLIMDRYLAGNAYAYKARYQDGPLKGAVGELWRMRPDRVRVVPGNTMGDLQYSYTVGRDVLMIPAKDVIHFRTRNPLNDFYGMPPMMPIMGRLQIDSYMRGFLRTFFENGGTGPGAILTSKNKMNDDRRKEITERYGQKFGGPSGWFQLLVLDSTETTYQQMGLNRGLRDALPKEIDAMQEAKISMVFGIPGSILGTLIGYESSSYANKRQDWQVLWDVTLSPLYSDFDDQLNKDLTGEFGGIDEVLFDLTEVRALQEDVDKINARWLARLEGGGCTLEEFREAVGMEAVTLEGHYLIPIRKLVVPADELDTASTLVAPTVPAAPTASTSPNPTETEQEAPANLLTEAACGGCGRWLARNINPEAVVFCQRCKETTLVSV